MLLGKAMLRSTTTTKTILNRLSVQVVNYRFKSTTTTSSFIFRRTTAQPSNKAKAALNTVRDKARDKLTETRCLSLPSWLTQAGRPIEFSISELCGHASFLLVAASYAVDDFLMLRVIAVAGSTSMLVFTYFHPHGRALWLPFKWNVLFILINSYRIGRVLFERYEVRNMTHAEMKLHHDHFQVMDLVDFNKLLRIGKMESFGGGDVVVHQGQMNSTIRLVLSGNLDVERDGMYTYSLEEGNFISESGLHIGLKLTGAVESSGTVIARGRCQTISWERDELWNLLDQEKDLKRSFLSALSWDIIGKLKSQRLYLMRKDVKNSDLWTEKRNSQSDSRYAAILKNILSRSNKLTQRSRDEIQNYRVIHHIDEEHHAKALEHCGWTVKEFDSGLRNRIQRRRTVMRYADAENLIVDLN